MTYHLDPDRAPGTPGAPGAPGAPGPEGPVTYVGPALSSVTPRTPRRISVRAAIALCVISALGAGAVTLGVSAGTVGAGAGSLSASTGGLGAQVTAAAPVAVAAISTTAQPGAVGAIAKAVGPAVVAIIVDGRNGAAGRPGPQVVGPRTAGSGVIVDPSGLVLTNRHVVGDARTVNVFLTDGREFSGAVAGVDTLTDLALVKIDAGDVPAVKLGDSSSVEVGELAVAIGNPEGDLPGSVTAGIVSALERQIVVGDQLGAQPPELLRHLIQHDAAINPGNSGGPLLAADGSVIGINSAIAGGTEGIGFAIPIDLAKPIVRQVLAGDPIKRPYIGIYFTEIDRQLAQDENLAVSSGVVIGDAAQGGQSGVIAGGPADRAGLRDGDILTEIDGQPIDAVHQLDVALLQREPGDAVTLTVLRGDQTQQREVSLGVRPADTAQ